MARNNSAKNYDWWSEKALVPSPPKFKNGYFPREMIVSRKPLKRQLLRRSVYVPNRLRFRPGADPSGTLQNRRHYIKKSTAMETLFMCDASTSSTVSISSERANTRKATRLSGCHIVLMGETGPARAATFFAGAANPRSHANFHYSVLHKAIHYLLKPGRVWFI